MSDLPHYIIVLNSGYEISLSDINISLEEATRKIDKIEEVWFSNIEYIYKDEAIIINTQNIAAILKPKKK